MKRTILTGLFCFGLATPAFAQDSDGDGVPDSADAFPCDASLASILYAPSESTWTMLSFEDQWPSWSDLDFNDVVVRTHYRFYLDSQGLVRRVVALIDPVALGGDYDNGLAVQLPVSRAGVTARRRVGGGAFQTLTLEPDAEVTVILSDNLRELFGGLEGPINSVQGAPTMTGQRLELELTFSTPGNLDTGFAPFDVFIFRSGDFGHQIHLPRHSGTLAMNTALFGTDHDASAPGHYFVHLTGTPAALNLQDTALYPQENVAIDELFPNIVSFALSGGLSHPDFYRTQIVTSRGRAAAATTLPAEPEADQSCIQAPSLYDFTQHTFTTCGRSGNLGPSLAQCRSSYGNVAWSLDTTRFGVSGGIQTWTVPRTGTYRLEARGAAGAGSSGRGAILRANFNLQQGEQLRILVGQAGTSNATDRRGGGGGSFIARASGQPLLVAGGGSGDSVGAARDGRTFNTGTGGGAYGGSVGCGGGGWSADGAGQNGCFGRSFAAGGQGGSDTGRTNQGVGGFGGGGGTHTTSQPRFGGGGGYQGGDGGYYNSGSGIAGVGGGSFIAAGATSVATSDGRYAQSTSFGGAAIQNLQSYQAGHGVVIVTLVP